MRPEVSLSTALSSRVSHLRSKLRKKLRLGHGIDELEPDLARKPVHFRAPPLDGDLLAAIQLISPQFHLRGDEASRRFWQLNQNGLSWGEYEALQPFLRGLEPRKVLDIGPGLGRSVVFFKKAEGWQDVPFHLYEGSGESTRYTRDGPRFEDSFCGDFDALRAVLGYNETGSYEIFDAKALDTQLSRLPGPYDFIYSFFAVGWHWSLFHFLDEILELLSDRGLGAFTLHDAFTDYEGLRRVPHRLVEFRRSWPRNRRSEMVVLARSEETLSRALT